MRPAGEDGLVLVCYFLVAYLRFPSFIFSEGKYIFILTISYIYVIIYIYLIKEMRVLNSLLSRKYRFEVFSGIRSDGTMYDEFRFESRYYAKKYLDEVLFSSDAYLSFIPDSVRIEKRFDYFVIVMSYDRVV